MNSVVNSGSNVFSNGTGGNFFTFTAGFGEAVNFATQGGGVGFANFVFDANNPVNFFNMYATSATAVDLTGAGFVNGTPILTGHVASITTSSFTSNLGSSANLDGFGSDDWSGQQTVTGSGASNITIMIDSANAGYFPDLPIGTVIVMSLFNNSQIDPYSQVDPSKCFNTSTACTAGGHAPSIGGLNGGISGTPVVASGPDFMLARPMPTRRSPQFRNLAAWHCSDLALRLWDFAVSVAALPKNPVVAIQPRQCRGFFLL